MFVAVYGGSFDPPHNVHRQIVADLLRDPEISEVLVVPAVGNPLKPRSLAPFDLRHRACAEIFARFGSRVTVSTAAKRLFDTTGSRYTFDLLDFLTGRMPGHRLRPVIGADILTEAKSWHRWADVEEQYGFKVVGREGYQGGGAPYPNVSSTDIRNRLKQGQTVRHLVPAEVRPLLPEFAAFYREAATSRSRMAST